ncbi:tyrosine-type recombinase/integrase [Paludisphaera rhizosphaerae]|uniref:tyrosine-type recombinase/integrase n=1 Tax=Paludisphaera rhizosphaerae TaxID=2711216 RepID=UPI0013EA8C14|nr:tyrosine-type recombinase/integrase [Paludisphaera rhizosphaerae]
MKCFVRVVNGNYHVGFEYAGKQYTHSLRTKSKKEADVRVGVIRDTLYRLESGTLEIPPGADVKSFVVAGGKIVEAPKPIESITLERLRDEYSDARIGVESNTRKTIRIHLNHVAKILGASTSLRTLGLVDVERYAKLRLRKKRNGKPTSGYTTKKELRTLKLAWSWAAERGLAQPPDWEVGSISLPKDRGREPFRTFDQIAKILSRGGVSPEEEDRLWETLYCDSRQVGELLDYVEATAPSPWIVAMVAFVALTGCRRSEMCRSRLEDWDLEAGTVRIREKKRDTSRDVTFREIDVHPRLKQIVATWFAAHPGGPWAISQDGTELNVDQATDHLARLLRDDPRWSKIRGFHTLRHSVASILASKGVDQRYIDRVLGHQTEAMRRRYQHLMPRGVKAAIDELL